jgi:ABC-type multidrug transport system fused ATPase/permease subunit
MFYISPPLAGVSIVSVFIIFMVDMPLGKKLGTLSKAYQNVLGEAQTYSTEAFGSMRTVQAFAAEPKETRRFRARIGNPDDFPWWYPTNTQQPSTYRVGFFKALTNASFYVFIFGAGFGFLYVSLWYGFFLVTEGQMTLGDLTAFQSYIFTIGFGLGGAASHFARVFEGLGASGRVFFLLERIPAIPKPAAAATPQDGNDDVVDKDQLVTESVVTPSFMTGDIEFHSVNFAYPSRADILVLKDFSLKIPANTTTALVGSSGAGKSTVVALLQRFYDVSSGTITIDGTDLELLDLQWLRRHIGYVQQEPQLFGLSIRENLLYGVEREEEITQEEMEQACRDANAYDFIMSWPNGFETMVGGKIFCCCSLYL